MTFGIKIDWLLFIFSDGFVLLWKKSSAIVAVGEQLIDKSDTRVKLENNENGNGNTLVISLAEPKDAGEYTCQISAAKPTFLKHSVRVRGKTYFSRLFLLFFNGSIRHWKVFADDSKAIANTVLQRYVARGIFSIRFYRILQEKHRVLVIADLIAVLVVISRFLTG